VSNRLVGGGSTGCLNGLQSGGMGEGWSDWVAAAILDNPVIGYHTIVDISALTSTTEETNYPVSNLANPATNLKWMGTALADEYITLDISYVDGIDYVGIAGHNFGSAGIGVSVEGYISGSWVNIVDEVMPANDGPYLGRFTTQSLDQIRIKMTAGSEVPQAAVLYVGKLLVMERKLYVGHTPMVHARKTSVVNGRSESGAFLGRIVTTEWRETTAPFSLITPEWYREFMDPFLEEAAETPFFFGWRPETYPQEIGFGWLMDDPMPTPVTPCSVM